MTRLIAHPAGSCAQGEASREGHAPTWNRPELVDLGARASSGVAQSTGPQTWPSAPICSATAVAEATWVLASITGKPRPTRRSVARGCSFYG